MEQAAGNLSVQLRNLEAAAYVQIIKSTEGRKPVTRVGLTRQWLQALSSYLGRMKGFSGR